MASNKKFLLVDLSNYENLSEKGRRSINLFSIPIGLMSLATFLKKNKIPMEIKIISFGIDYNNDEELMEIIRRYSPNFIGIRALSANEKILVHIVDALKKLLPDIFIIIGGPYSSSPDEEDFKKIAADIFIVGEGEETVLELFKRLMKNESYDDIKGIVFKKGKKIIINEKREFIENFGKIPFPDYEMIDYEKYFKMANWGYMVNRYALIESSRGCPYGCIFCHKIFGRAVRLRNAEVISDEIIRLHKKYNITDFFFVDDIFNINYQRANDIFDKIINSKIKMRFHFPNGLRGDLLDKNLIDRMIRAGVVSVALAIETPSPRLQKYINKNVVLPKLKRNIDYACDKGMMVRLFFMYGFPTETEEEVENTILYMKQFKKCVIPYFFAAKYYKNSKMYSLALEEGFSAEELEKSKKGLYNEIQFCETPLLSRDFLKKMHYRWINEVILNKERLLNALSIQRKHHTDEEIKLFYSSFFGKEIKNVNDLIGLCR